MTDRHLCEVVESDRQQKSVPICELHNGDYFVFSGEPDPTLRQKLFCNIDGLTTEVVTVSNGKKSVLPYKTPVYKARLDKVYYTKIEG